MSESENEENYENDYIEENSNLSQDNIVEDGEEEEDYLTLSLDKANFTNFNQIYELSKKTKDDKGHITSPFISKYEKTKILGIRTQQLASGSPALIKIPRSITNLTQIAEMEFKQKKIPYIIERKMPNNSSEYWRISDLIDLN